MTIYGEITDWLSTVFDKLLIDIFMWTDYGTMV